MGPRDEVIIVKELRCSLLPSSEVLELACVKRSGPPHDGLAPLTVALEDSRASKASS